VQEVGVRLLRGLSTVRAEQCVYDESWGVGVKEGERERARERKSVCVCVFCERAVVQKFLFLDKNLNNSQQLTEISFSKGTLLRFNFVRIVSPSSGF